MISKQRAIVIGAGIAGLSVASQLQRNGWSVTLLESSSSIASKASGNYAGILSPYILSQHDRNGEFLGAAFNYTMNWFDELHENGVATTFNQTGIVQLPATRRITRMVSEVFAGTLAHQDLGALNANEASDVCGVKLNSPALFYRRGGWIKPVELCKALARDCANRIKLIFNAEVVEIKSVSAALEVNTADANVHAGDVVVLANAYECMKLEVTNSLPLEPVRGIVATASPSKATESLKTVLCHNGYIIPFSDRLQVLGTTYRHGVFHTERDLEEESELKSNVVKWIPDASVELNETRICFRTSTSDRLPYVGAVKNPEGEAIKGLYVTVGHGSRGLVTAPFSAHLVCQMVSDGEVDGVAELVEPARQ